MSNISHAADWVGERRADNVSLAPGISEDWLSLIIGLAIFLLALAGLANVNLIGWVVTTAVWSNLGAALNTASATYRGLGGVGALVATYLALLAVLGAAALALKSDLKKFALAFTAVFFIAYASWIVGSYANFAVLAGLVIANVFPRFVVSLSDQVMLNFCSSAGVTANLHRRLGLRAGLHLDQSHQRDRQQGSGSRDLGAFPEVHHRLRHHLCGRALPRPGDARRDRIQSPCRDRRGQHVPGDLLHPDVLLDWRAVELQALVGGRHRQARCSLFRHPVRLRDLGGPSDFVAVLRRHETPTGELKERTMSHFELQDELNRQTAEPLLPIEKKLIGWSFSIGLVLLLVLGAINHLFPAA
jgi:hypothetical protein